MSGFISILKRGNQTDEVYNGAGSGDDQFKVYFIRQIWKNMQYGAEGIPADIS